ncbi:protein of unknown function [Methylacidimicrobium sp. AP8]|nr:protein of unknown function [Methylacidimicrobium sp. AP8]
MVRNHEYRCPSIRPAPTRTALVARFQNIVPFKVSVDQACADPNRTRSGASMTPVSLVSVDQACADPNRRRFVSICNTTAPRTDASADLRGAPVSFDVALPETTCFS